MVFTSLIKFDFDGTNVKKDILFLIFFIDIK